jgi:hypothetical protein
MSQDKAGNSVIIHIGFPKTATTWLQKRYFPKVQNFKYIPPSVTNSDIVGCNDFFAQKIALDWLKGNKIIISNENLLGLARISEFIRIGLAERLKKLFPNAHIVIFIRNQIDLIASEYSWYIKNSGGTYNPNDFVFKSIRNPYGLFLYKVQNLQYDKVIDLYQQLFGKKNIHIFLYEDLKNNPKFFLENFSKQFCFDVQLDLIDYSPINIMLRKRLLPLVRLLNFFSQPKILYRHHFISLPYLGNYIPRIAGWLNNYSIWGDKPESNQVLGQVLTNELTNYFKESNQRLIDHYALKEIKNYNYPL